MTVAFVALEENLTEQFIFNLFNLIFSLMQQETLFIRLLEKQQGVVHSRFTHFYIYTG